MLFTEISEPNETPKLSPKEIRRIITNTRVRIQQAIYELKKEESYGVLNAELVEWRQPPK